MPCRMDDFDDFDNSETEREPETGTHHHIPESILVSLRDRRDKRQTKTRQPSLAKLLDQLKAERERTDIVCIELGFETEKLICARRGWKERRPRGTGGYLYTGRKAGNHHVTRQAARGCEHVNVMTNTSDCSNLPKKK